MAVYLQQCHFHRLYSDPLYAKMYLTFFYREVDEMAKNRILIVEDDKAIVESIAMNLQYSQYDYLIIDAIVTMAESVQIGELIS